MQNKLLGIACSLSTHNNSFVYFSFYINKQLQFAYIVCNIQWVFRFARESREKLVECGGRGGRPGLFGVVFNTTKLNLLQSQENNHSVKEFLRDTKNGEKINEQINNSLPSVFKLYKFVLVPTQRSPCAKFDTIGKKSSLT